MFSGALFVHEASSQVDPLHLMAYCRTLGVKFIYEDKFEEDEPESEYYPNYNKHTTISKTILNLIETLVRSVNKEKASL